MAEKVAGYGVVMRQTVEALVEAVEKLIKQGWIPIGGVSQLSVAVGSCFAQAMLETYDA